jgi:hypothetical protein
MSAASPSRSIISKEIADLCRALAASSCSVSILDAVHTMSVIVSQMTLIGCRPARISRCSAVASPSRTKASSISIVKPRQHDRLGGPVRRIASAQPSELPASISSARCRSAPIAMARCQRHSAPSHDGTANTTRRATARRWRACCRGSLAVRPEIVVVCSRQGGYSRQQCHGKFRPVRAIAGHGAGPGRRMIGGWHWRGRSEARDVSVPRLRPRRPAASSFGLKLVFANGFSVRAGDFYLKPPATNILHSGECFMSSVGGEAVSQKSLVPSFGNNGVGQRGLLSSGCPRRVRYSNYELLDSCPSVQKCTLRHTTTETPTMGPRVNVRMAPVARYSAARSVPYSAMSYSPSARRPASVILSHVTFIDRPPAWMLPGRRREPVAHQEGQHSRP